MLTNVNCMVAYDWSSSTKNEKMNNKKQIPSITTQLTRILHFFPKTPDFVTTKTFETVSLYLQKIIYIHAYYILYFVICYFNDYKPIKKMLKSTIKIIKVKHS